MHKYPEPFFQRIPGICKPVENILLKMLPFCCHKWLEKFENPWYYRLFSISEIIPTRLRVLSHSYFSPYFGLISVRFLSFCFVFLCILCVLSPFGTVLVSKFGINFLKKRRRKNRYSFSVSDTWLCPTVQPALMFEYKGGCKGRAPLEAIIL